MMKLRAQLAETEHELSLDFVDEGVKATVNDRTYDLEVRELTGSEYLLFSGTRVFRCRVDPKDSQNAFVVSQRARTHEITIVDPKRLRSAYVASVQDHGSAVIVSPMPGKVVRVLVEAGAQVEAGAGIVVVEAMKMQNEMKSPKSGVVVSINAEAGATVNAGDVLAVIE